MLTGFGIATHLPPVLDPTLSMVPPFAAEALQRISHRAASEDSDMGGDTGANGTYSIGGDDSSDFKLNKMGDSEEAAKKKKNRTGHGVGNGTTASTYTRNNKPIEWVPPPTFPYNLIPNRDLTAHVTPARPVIGSPITVTWPPFREDGPKPKKKSAKDKGEAGIDDDRSVSPGDDASMDVDEDESNFGESSKIPKPKPKLKGKGKDVSAVPWPYSDRCI